MENKEIVTLATIPSRLSSAIHDFYDELFLAGLSPYDLFLIDATATDFETSVKRAVARVLEKTPQRHTLDTPESDFQDEVGG